MGETVVVYIVAELTHDRPFDYLTSIALTTAIPMLLATLALPRWARYLDRVHIASYRATHAGMLTVIFLITWLGVSQGSLWIIAVARILIGISRAGGILAWNLGHNDFADRRLVALYMGIHVTLTGVRGVIFPFLGILLLNGWDATSLEWLGISMPPFGGIGADVLLLCEIPCLISLFGFHMLARSTAAPRKP